MTEASAYRKPASSRVPDDPGYSILRAEPLSTFATGPYKGVRKDMRSAGYVVDQLGLIGLSAADLP